MRYTCFGSWLICMAAMAAIGQRAHAEKDLATLMADHQPPYVRPKVPPDPAITFERVDVMIERGFPGPYQMPYLSIGRDGGYLYKINAVDLPEGRSLPGTMLIHRLPGARLAELQRQLEATRWLGAPGGEGPATHTDADRMTIAVTLDGGMNTILLNGRRPAPYAALQKFFLDLALQEHLYYRLTRLKVEERREATRDLHGMIESALGLPHRMPAVHDFTFERYHDLFAGMLEEWYRSETQELLTAVDLMVLLKRDAHAAAIARLRYDREPSLRMAVARALPILMGRQAIPLLKDMIDSTEPARWNLIQLGEPAVPAIVSIIEPGVTLQDLKSEWMVRAYLDHWEEIAAPIDPRILDAARRAIDKSADGARLEYFEQFLTKAGNFTPPRP